MIWQILDVGSIWMKEFAAALARQQQIVAWSPTMLATGALQNWERPLHIEQPPLHFLEFPLQRGYSRPPLRWLVPFQHGLLRHLLHHSADPLQSALICSTPFYAPVAALWPGPVVYYSTDLTIAYEGLNPKQVTQLERQMCRVATIICPNSRRIAQHLTTNVACDPEKITIIPNATRSSNIATVPRLGPGPPPEDVANLPRPIIGVLGDLSANMDWELLASAIRLTPGFSWLFVGPTGNPIHGAAQQAAFTWIRQRSRFVGRKPYGELQAYARCLDVAVLPYRKREPTYSGSSTRFYEHLAALRPMVATRGFAELLEKEPLLCLIDSPEELASALQQLRANSFIDGQEEARWKASRLATWDERARSLVQALTMSHPSLSRSTQHETMELKPQQYPVPLRTR